MTTKAKLENLLTIINRHPYANKCQGVQLFLQFEKSIVKLIRKNKVCKCSYLLVHGVNIESKDKAFNRTIFTFEQMEEFLKDFIKSLDYFPQVLRRLDNEGCKSK